MRQRKGNGLRRLEQALPYLVMLGAYLVSVLFYAVYGGHNMNADDASEMVYAALLNREDAFLSSNWLYSTELRVISPVPLYQLGLKLFSSWHMAKAFGMAITLAGVLAAALFMMRQLSLRRSAPWLAAALAIPFSGTYAYIVVFESYYAVHLLMAFLMVGLVCRYGRTGFFGGGGVSLLLLALLGLISGLGGVRMLSMIVAPLAAGCCLLAVYTAKDAPQLRDAAHEPGVRMGAASLAMLAAAALGYLVNNRVLAGQYRYHSYTDLNMASFELADFWHQFSNVVRDLGYKANVPMFSMEGIGSWISLAIAAALAFAVVRLMRSWKALRAEHRMLLLTCLLAIALGMALNVLLQQMLTRYFIVGTLLLFAVLFAEIENELGRHALIRNGAMALVVLCLAFNGQNMLRYTYTMGEVNYEIAAQWLLDRGYTQGYATFWNANTLTAASDGQIEMWVLEDGRREQWMNLSLHDILQSREHYTRDPEGKVFLLVDEMENKTDAPLLDPAYLASEEMVAWSYYVYEYDSVEQMRALIAQGNAQ